MTFQFRPAKRSESKPLIGLYAESGNGKTWSALLLARGFVGPSGRIGMIETEGGRGEANVGREPGGDDLVCPIRKDFSPRAYGEAIDAAETANLDALIVDSASHEWEGAGGVLSMAADNQAAGKKGVLVWQQPKIEHQRYFMGRLMQTPIPLVIVCMRAKYPMQQVKGDWARSTVLEPKQADDILFEMLVHGWIDTAHKMHVTKYTIPDLASVIRDGEPISIETGQRLATWARGGTAAPVHQPAGAADTETDVPSAADYHQQWTDRMQRATKPEHLAQWNLDKALHKQIGWTSAHSYEDLKAKVLKAVDSMRAPA
jgi:hypothetical protein